jgi:hypothetical protein
MVQLTPKTEKHELENEKEVCDGPDEEEGSKNSEAEDENPTENLRRFTW